MKSFINFINERLNKSEWIKYDDGESPVDQDLNSNSVELSDYITNIMNTDITNLLYTTSHMNAAEDFTFFKAHIINKAEQQSTKTVHTAKTQMYITSYLYDSKSFILVEIRDPYEYSFIIINEKDFEFFDFETDPNYITIPRDDKESIWSAFGQRTPGPGN